MKKWCVNCRFWDQHLLRECYCGKVSSDTGFCSKVEKDKIDKDTFFDGTCDFWEEDLNG